MRGRLERDIGFKTVKGADDTDYQSRLRFGFEASATPWLRFYVQAQDADVAGFDRSLPPASIDSSVDLYQSYVEIGARSGGAWWLRLGRQELNFGDRRLVGDGGWANSGRSFDAVRLHYRRPGMQFDWLASAVVVQLPSRFDHPQLKNGFYGVYASLDRLIPEVSVEPYLFWKVQSSVRGETGSTGSQSEFTSGVRAVGPLPGNFSFNMDTALQWGHCARDRIRAWAGHYAIVRPLGGLALRPRWSIEFNRATGDDGADGTRGTFDALYANNHDKYGLIDRFAWRNLNDLATAVDVKPGRRWTGRVAFHYFWLANRHDAIYSQGAVSARWKNATSGRLGPEIDFQAAYALNRHLDFAAGYGRLWAGPYLRAAASCAGSSYPYVMLTYRM